MMSDLKILRNVASTIRSANTVGFPDFRLNAAKSIEGAADEIERLRREIEYLRHYGNKHCTAMADEALERGDMES